MDKNQSNYQLVGLEYSKELDDQPLISIQTSKEAEFKKVLALAKKYNVPVVSDPGLLNQLNSLEEGESLPEKLFKVIAALFIKVEQILASSRNI